MRQPFIPPRTRAELESPAPPGHRHEQMISIVLPLLGAGLSEDAVFVQFRGMYDTDLSDREILDVINWAASTNPKPCGRGYQVQGCRQTRPLPVPSPVTSEEATANAEKWLR